MNYPSIWGADALFTHGSSGSLTGRLCSDKLGIRFENAMGCTVALNIGNIVKIEYECVMPDWIKARVYRKSGEVDFEIIAVSPQGVLISSSEKTGISVTFEGEFSFDETDGVRTFICGEETAALCLKEGKNYVSGFAMGENCRERAQNITNIDIDLRREFLRQKYISIKLPKGISESYEKLYRRCQALVKSNIFTDGKNNVFAKRSAHGLNVNTRQAMLLAVGLKNIFPKEALSTVVYLTEFIDEKGILPVNVQGGFGDSSCACPLLPWAFYQIAGDNKELVKNVYAALRRHVMYYINERDMNKNSLYHWLAGGKNNPCEDSGMENSPRFADNVIIEAPDLCAYLYLSLTAMGKMSELINENSDVLYWNVIADRIRIGVNDFLYSDDEKFFFDRGVVGKKLRKIKTIAGFMPVFGGMCSEVRENQILNHISDKNTFGAKFGIPSAARSESSFKSDMYSGAVYFEENYKIAFGLIKSGKREKAAELVSRCLEAALRGYESGGVIYEYYSPVSAVENAIQQRGGNGGGNMSIYGYNTCIRDCAASAGFLISMIELLSNG